jgi:hypothetical protein
MHDLSEPDYAEHGPCGSRVDEKDISHQIVYCGYPPKSSDVDKLIFMLSDTFVIQTIVNKVCGVNTQIGRINPHIHQPGHIVNDFKKLTYRLSLRALRMSF